jgi:hypothetical protein
MGMMKRTSELLGMSIISRYEKKGYFESIRINIIDRYTSISVSASFAMHYYLIMESRFATAFGAPAFNFLD